MCKAKKYINNFIETVELTIKDYEEVKKKLGLIEKQILDIEHFIEMGNFDIIQGYYFSKSLQKLRNKRRDLKNEKETLKILRDTFNKNINVDFYKSIKNTVKQKDGYLNKLNEEKIYNPRKLNNIDKTNIKEFCESI